LTSVEQSSYEAFVRALISVLGIALLSAGCFKPSVKNGGFACDPTVTPACPSGFYCVNQLCVDHPGVSNGNGGGGGTIDMSIAPDDSGTPMQSADLAMSQTPADMAKTVTPPDLFTPPGGPPDLAQPPVNSCAHDFCTTGAKLKTGCADCVTAVCAQDPVCCSSQWDSICVSEVASFCSAADQCP
jgi:hypothetical protein